MLYYCNDCVICTCNLSDYNKHLKTNKHHNKVKNQNTATFCIKNQIIQNKQDPNENINLNINIPSTNDDNNKMNKLLHEIERLLNR